MSNELNRLFEVLSTAASHAIDVASEDEGLCVDIHLTTKGFLVEAMMQKTSPYSHHQAPDGYCNQEIPWEELAAIDVAEFRTLIDELLDCAMSGGDGEEGGGDLEQLYRSGVERNDRCAQERRYVE